MCPSLTSKTGCLVSQPPRLLTIHESHQGAGGREIPPSLCVCRAHSGHVGGSGHWVRAQSHTFCLHWAAVLLSACGGGCVCPVLRAPAVGQGRPTLRLLGESVGWVTCGFLQPTTEPQTRGVHGACGLWRSLIDPGVTGGAAHCGWKVLGRAEYFPAPGALEGAELPVSPLRLGHLRRDGTLRATPLADPSCAEGGGGQQCVERGGGCPPLSRAPSRRPATVPHQVPASMAFVTDSNRPQPLWKPPSNRFWGPFPSNASLGRGDAVRQGAVKALLGHQCTPGPHGVAPGGGGAFGIHPRYMSEPVPTSRRWMALVNTGGLPQALHALPVCPPDMCRVHHGRVPLHNSADGSAPRRLAVGRPGRG